MNNSFVKILLSAAILTSVLGLSACGGRETDKTTAGTSAAETTAVETATVPNTTTQIDTQPTVPVTQSGEATTAPATQKPDEKPDETPAPQLTVGQTVTVNHSATHFGSKSGNVGMANFMPGYSFTLYQISGDQVLIGLDGIYTGWVNKTDIEGAGTGNAEPDEPDTKPTEPVTTPGTTNPATTSPTTTRPTTTKPATTQPATTQPDTSIKAPVGGSITQIVSFYNQYADELRNYSGKVTVNKSDGTVTVINSISGGGVVRNLAQDLLPNDYSAKPQLTFVNGKSGGTSLAKHLPRGDEAKMSILQPAGVASATCVKSGSGWKVTIALKPESVNQLSGVPKYTAQCMDTLSLTDNDLKPFSLQSATVTYSNCKIDAVMDSLGRITKLDVDTPATITGKLKYGFIGIDADITGNYNGNYTFAY